MFAYLLLSSRKHKNGLCPKDNCACEVTFGKPIANALRQFADDDGAQPSVCTLVELAQEIYWVARADQLAVSDLDTSVVLPKCIGEFVDRVINDIIPKELDAHKNCEVDDDDDDDRTVSYEHVRGIPTDSGADPEEAEEKQNHGEVIELLDSDDADESNDDKNKDNHRFRHTKQEILTQVEEQEEQPPEQAINRDVLLTDALEEPEGVTSDDEVVSSGFTVVKCRKRAGKPQTTLTQYYDYSYEESPPDTKSA